LFFLLPAMTGCTCWLLFFPLAGTFCRCFYLQHKGWLFFCFLPEQAALVNCVFTQLACGDRLFLFCLWLHAQEIMLSDCCKIAFPSLASQLTGIIFFLQLNKLHRLIVSFFWPLFCFSLLAAMAGYTCCLLFFLLARTCLHYFALFSCFALQRLLFFCFLLWTGHTPAGLDRLTFLLFWPTFWVLNAPSLIEIRILIMPFITLF